MRVCVCVCVCVRVCSQCVFVLSMCVCLTNVGLFSRYVFVLLVCV